jgi:D-alanyl-D-alanine carboxypeptidase (penicillin-binding protein 5/6)
MQNMSPFTFRCTLGGILAVAWLAGSATLANGAPEKDEFQTSAPYAILIEAESGTILFEKNADDLVAPSSLAKLMTSEVVFNEIKEGNLKLDQEFVISENAWRNGGAPSGGSTMFAELNSRVSVENLLRGVIIQSANDGCIALAEGIAGSEDTFVRMMNARARELGLTQSHFTNASGLPDPDMRVTVRELALLARHIIATYPEFYKLYGEREFTWNKILQRNRNPLLALNLGADGMKTGYTKEGGYGLVGSAVQDGLRLIVVVNGMKTAKDRAQEARRLLEWGFNGFEARLLFAGGQTVGHAKLFGGEDDYVPLVAAGGKPIALMVPRNTTDRIVARIVYRGPVRAPIEKGRAIGELKIWRGDRIALEVPLEAAGSVGQGSVPQRAIDAAEELVIGLFRAGISKL